MASFNGVWNNNKLQISQHGRATVPHRELQRGDIIFVEEADDLLVWERVEVDGVMRAYILQDTVLANIVMEG